jgi:hypothetical protein
MIFEILCIVHILIWAFVILAFLNKDLAYYNIYYVIPIIYLIHMLPFHILIKLKEKCDPDNYKNHEESFYETLIIPKLFKDTKKVLENYCFASPLSPQGVLIFGLITSIFSLYPPTYLKFT